MPEVRENITALLMTSAHSNEEENWNLEDGSSQGHMFWTSQHCHRHCWSFLTLPLLMKSAACGQGQPVRTAHVAAQGGLALNSAAYRDAI